MKSNADFAILEKLSTEQVLQVHVVKCLPFFCLTNKIVFIHYNKERMEFFVMSQSID
jgi:hypothetical protein